MINYGALLKYRKDGLDFMESIKLEGELVNMAVGGIPYGAMIRSSTADPSKQIEITTTQGLGQFAYRLRS